MVSGPVANHPSDPRVDSGHWPLVSTVVRVLLDQEILFAIRVLYLGSLP